MSGYATLVAHLKSAEYLGLREISQAYDGPLRLVLEEQRTSPNAEKRPDLDISAFSIEHTNEDKIFELIWDDYVSVSLTADEYPPHDGSYTGAKSGYFQENLPSDFLTYIQAEKSQLFDIYDGELKNWKIVTLTRYVEVVSYSPLQISLLR